MTVTFLSMDDVRSLINMKDVIGAVDEAFREKARGKVQMPPKVYLFFHEYEGDFRVMPGYIPSLKSAGVKVVNVHVKNKDKGLPTVMATILLLDPETGEPMAILDGTLLTSMRTGAAGAIAAREMAKKGFKKVAFVGAGTQAKYQLLGLNEIAKGLTGKAYDVSEASVEKFSEYAKSVGAAIDVASSVKECISDADVIITTTPATEPVVRNGWVPEGAHINAIGADAPGKEELDPEVLLRARIIVDDMEQAVHSGEVNVPILKGLLKQQKIAGEIGQVLEGKIKGRTSEKEITVFDSTGLAIQDIASASLALRRAVEKGIGVKLRLF
ncbi:MAG: alanine dehydrogenase [Nitrososphaerota archaeon]|jgi:alanine dehydrogenase|nr:alanine dehydrogenase [Nitrososphaerota archaeon]MDG6932041.1 alanine dehydrogenase [Nitrososphaerota archaeon]MDG6935416.1 alanine dehydrogenase [Nitrososphaerota archaeon]MDG6944580.1 alanine dehydrogenase [Nitrososphaerota archaeon]